MARAQQLAAEVAALTKTVEEKTAAVAAARPRPGTRPSRPSTARCESDAADDATAGKAEKAMLDGASQSGDATRKRWPRWIAAWKRRDEVAKLPS